MRFLAIEDDDPICKLTKMWLMDIFGQDNEFVCAHSIHAGLEAVSLGADLILLDLRLPGSSDPKSTLVTFEEWMDRIPTIVMTGFCDAALGLQAIECGAKAYICKPVSMEDFREAVEEAINIKKDK